jgi:hypothetical protein
MDRRPPTDSIGLKAVAFEPTRFAQNAAWDDENPRQFPAGGRGSSLHDHAITDRSRDGRGSEPSRCPGRRGS